MVYIHADKALMFIIYMNNFKKYSGAYESNQMRNSIDESATGQLSVLNSIASTSLSMDKLEAGFSKIRREK